MESWNQQVILKLVSPSPSEIIGQGRHEGRAANPILLPPSEIAAPFQLLLI
jgi:hypothetical protein